MERLSRHFDVIVPDHPGFGASDTPDWLDNIGDLAYFYLDTMKQLGLDRRASRRAPRSAAGSRRRSRCATVIR